MSKFNKRYRFRIVILGISQQPKYGFECRDVFGESGYGLSIPAAYKNYLSNQR